MKSLFSIFFIMASLFPMKLYADNPSPFKFQTIQTINEMTGLITDRLQLGSSRQELRKLFVSEGNATLIKHPTQVGVEKYIYDINLCRLYIWRWNISADFDQQGKLLQAYVNGNPVFSDGKPKKTVPKVAEKGKNAAIYKVQRPRPEADRGESSIAFILFDRDSDSNTIDDQQAIGAGPSRANPFSMGQMMIYKDVEPWRSIFDFDAANKIHDYQGSCKK